MFISDEINKQLGRAEVAFRAMKHCTKNQPVKKAIQ